MNKCTKVICFVFFRVLVWDDKLSDNFSDYSGNSGLDEEDDDFDEKNDGLGKGKDMTMIYLCTLTSTYKSFNLTTNKIWLNFCD